MSELKFDLRDGGSLIKDRNGYRMTRIGILTSTDAATDTAATALKAAIDDGLLPDIGDEHPSITGIYVNSIECDGLSKNEFRVSVLYMDDPGFPGTTNISKRVSATLSPKQTRVDYLDAPLKVSYQTTADLDASPSATTTTEYFTAQIERPRAEFEFEYTAAAFPKFEVDTYLGRINSLTWNGYAPETVLCTGISAVEVGSDWRVTVSFAYDPDGWEFTAVAAPPASQIEASTTSGFSITSGEKVFNLYIPVDFTGLGLTL